jgi:hypothetical protein
MQASEVQLHTGSIDLPYKVLGRVEAKRSKRSAFSADPTLDEVNIELQRKAAEMSANAIIDVEYKRGMSLISYGVLTAWGTAVLLESDDVNCRFCAEKIKRAAVKCRYCGEMLTAAQA